MHALLNGIEHVPTWLGSNTVREWIELGGRVATAMQAENGRYAVLRREAVTDRLVDAVKDGVR